MNPADGPHDTDASMPVNEAVDLLGWIAEHADAFRPPVANKVLWHDSDFIAMAIAGPNTRTDFHIDPADEIFHQIRGTIRVDLMVDGVRTEHLLHAGDVMLVPAGVPHSPRRPAGTIGLVIERPRAPQEFDALRWYCTRCDDVLHEVTFHVDDIETELAVALDAFHGDIQRRTCGRCGAVSEVPGPFEL